jgi:hypothetical protein
MASLFRPCVRLAWLGTHESLEALRPASRTPAHITITLILNRLLLCIKNGAI